jgi:hypothetical protein
MRDPSPFRVLCRGLPHPAMTSFCPAEVVAGWVPRNPRVGGCKDGVPSNPPCRVGHGGTTQHLQGDGRRVGCEDGGGLGECISCGDLIQNLFFFF